MGLNCYPETVLLFFLTEGVTNSDLEKEIDVKPRSRYNVFSELEDQVQFTLQEPVYSNRAKAMVATSTTCFQGSYLWQHLDTW